MTILAPDASDDLRAALASTLRNRFVASSRSDTPSVRDICQSVLREATGSKSAQISVGAVSSDVEWCRAMAINCLVWAGDLGDATNGATSCHRHDMTAPWAAKRAATALIGSYIFLR